MVAPSGRLIARTATRTFIPLPLPNLHHGAQQGLFDSAHSRALFATVTSAISDGRMCRSISNIGPAVGRRTGTRRASLVRPGCDGCAGVRHLLNTVESEWTTSVRFTQQRGRELTRASHHIDTWLQGGRRRNPLDNRRSFSPGHEYRGGNDRRHRQRPRQSRCHCARSIRARQRRRSRCGCTGSAPRESPKPRRGERCVARPGRRIDRNDSRRPRRHRC